MSGSACEPCVCVADVLPADLPATLGGIVVLRHRSGGARTHVHSKIQQSLLGKSFVIFFHLSHSWVSRQELSSLCFNVYKTDSVDSVLASFFCFQPARLQQQQLNDMRNIIDSRIVANVC